MKIRVADMYTDPEPQRSLATRSVSVYVFYKYTHFVFYTEHGFHEIHQIIIIYYENSG